MKRIYWAAAVYAFLGLLAGIFYREVTKATGFSGQSQLSVLHTHLLALGMLFFLVVLGLDKLFGISGGGFFGLFFWFYNAGLVITVGMMVVHGMRTVRGAGESAATAGIAGLGHILLTVGLVFLFLALRTPLFGAGSSQSRR